MTNDSLGNRIKSRLKELGKGPQWLATEIAAKFPDSKCDVKCISALISRNSQSTMYVLQIADILELNVVYLIDGTGSKMPDIAQTMNQDRKAYEGKVAAAVFPKSMREQLSEKISQAMDTLNENGLHVALGCIKALVDEYPRQAKQTPSS